MIDLSNICTVESYVSNGSLGIDYKRSPHVMAIGVHAAIDLNTSTHYGTDKIKGHFASARVSFLSDPLARHEAQGDTAGRHQWETLVVGNTGGCLTLGVDTAGRRPAAIEYTKYRERRTRNSEDMIQKCGRKVTKYDEIREYGNAGYGGFSDLRLPTPPSVRGVL
eukprot:1339348-Amorphochlora_amoeboformis.AAC.1